MQGSIQTDIREEEPVDNGIETLLVAEEEYVREGERIQRKTELRLLEDGGVHIQQSYGSQDLFDSLTLGDDVRRRLERELRK